MKDPLKKPSSRLYKLTVLIVFLISAVITSMERNSTIFPDGRVNWYQMKELTFTIPNKVMSTEILIYRSLHLLDKLVSGVFMIGAVIMLVIHGRSSQHSLEIRYSLVTIVIISFINFSFFVFQGIFFGIRLQMASSMVRPPLWFHIGSFLTYPYLPMLGSSMISAVILFRGRDSRTFMERICLIQVLKKCLHRKREPTVFQNVDLRRVAPTSITQT